jgi:transcriptional regulator with XRE-family HTH domain
VVTKKIVKNVRSCMGRKMTAYRLAKMADVHPSTVQRLLNGEMDDPGVQLIEKLARALDVTPATLLFGA